MPALACLGISATIWLAATVAPPVAVAQSEDQASLDVVSQDGDTIPIAREIIISREGISIDEVQGDVSKRIKTDARDRSRITIDIGDDDEDWAGYSGPGGPGEIVSFFRDVDVPKDKVVQGEIVTIFGDIRIDGEVNGDVVAVMGSIDLGDSARVGGDVVAIGGINQSPSATIQGDSVSLPILGFVPVVSAWGMWAGFIITALLASLLGAFVAYLFPDRLKRVAETGSQRTFVSLLVGAATFPLFFVTCALLFLTVIGIPVAMLMLLLYPVAAFVGYVAGSALLGSRLRGTALEAQPIWISALIGILFIGAFYIVGGILTNFGDASSGLIRAIGLGIVTVGVLLAAITSLLGMGALFVSRLGEPPQNKAAAETPASDTPPSSSSVPAPTSPTTP